MKAKQPKGKSRAVGAAALALIMGGGALVTIRAARDWTALAKARKLKNPFPPTAEALAGGMQVYANHCRSCHGPYGDGKGDKAAELSVAPGDFTNAWKMNQLTDGELYWQTTHGRRPMPSFVTKLTEQQRWEVVDYIRTFAQRKP
jgi:mono/diheme cytochrome c family protein